MSDLKHAFDAVFFAPYTSHAWESQRGSRFWRVDLELDRDKVAGPLFSIVTKGGCPELYKRGPGDQRYAGVHNPESLRCRIQEWHEKLTAALEQFVPASDAEARDQAYMRTLVAEMRTLIDRAIDIEGKRCEAQKRT